MEFCPKCKSLMLPLGGGRLKCRNASCGFERERSAGEAPTVLTTRRTKKEMTIVDENIQTRPTTKARCPACGNDTASWWLRQMRGADEPETRFLRCTKCGKTWREYS